MKRLLGLMLIGLLVALASMSSGAGAGAGVLAQDEASPVPGSSTVYIRQNPELGPYFTDRTGLTLYLFTKDTEAGVSVCNGDCATNWPPFTSEEPLSLPEGVEGELTTITRDDGTSQVAYNGIPLYYFAADAVAGDVNGQGVGEVWFVVAPGQQLGVVASPVASPEAGPAASPVAGEVTVELNEFAVVSSMTTFTVGETYTFVATNTGEFPHEMLIEVAGDRGIPLVDADGREAAIERIDGGLSGTLEWTFTEPGTYQLTCHVRDHYAHGMAVTIQVVA